MLPSAKECFLGRRPEEVRAAFFAAVLELETPGAAFDGRDVEPLLRNVRAGVLLHVDAVGRARSGHFEAQAGLHPPHVEAPGRHGRIR